MRPVAIIANPASGKDIRRLVAHGSVIPSGEKVNIIRRILLGLDSQGIEQVLLMPDQNKLGWRAVDGLNLSLEAKFLEIGMENTQDDSTRAAEMAAEMGAVCIIVLGGDGTNRVVAKSAGDTPLLPIATGTNNVFSNMVEGTLAGIAAGVFAANDLPLDEVTSQEPKLEVWRDSKMLDIALIDLVVSNEEFVASRALWSVSSLKEVFLTRAEPENIGFSSLGGYLCHIPQGAGKGLHMYIGPGGTTVNAPIAPGLVREVPIESTRIFGPDEDIVVKHTPAVIALDGEREFSVPEGEELKIRLNLKGPRVIRMTETLQKASKECLFTK
ncbi:MAG: ATP-NAD kinase [Proteobacteria bacterium]|nr:ATP-NAD kinase [Pseudomonadota bacterium]